MINFNEARITPDGQKLIIDISVDSRPYFEHVYIDSLSIDNQDSFTGVGPSGEALYTWIDEDPVIVNGQVVHKKYLRLELDVTSLNVASLSHHLFYIYVQTSGDFRADTPCEFEDRLFTRVVLDYGPIYRESMNYVKEINQNCEIPHGFIDRILKLNALELSLIAGHYSLANSYWNKFFAIQANMLKPNKCCSK